MSVSSIYIETESVQVAVRGSFWTTLTNPENRDVSEAEKVHGRGFAAILVETQ